MAIERERREKMCVEGNQMMLLIAIIHRSALLCVFLASRFFFFIQCFLFGY